LQVLIDHTQATVNGKVVVKLFKGNVIVTSRTSRQSLFDTRIATFDDDGGAYNQADAAGFIKLNALRMRIAGAKAQAAAASAKPKATQAKAAQPKAAKAEAQAAPAKARRPKA